MAATHLGVVIRKTSMKDEQAKYEHGRADLRKA
jgi:hypothetical protein